MCKIIVELVLGIIACSLSGLVLLGLVLGRFRAATDLNLSYGFSRSFPRCSDLVDLWEQRPQLNPARIDKRARILVAP